MQFGDVLAAAFGLIRAAAEDAAKQLLQPVGIEQAFLDMAGNHGVELVHGDGAPLAAGFALTRPDRAGIVAIAAALAGADGHGSAAIAAIADAGQKRGTDHHARGQFGLGISGLQELLHRLEGLPLDDRRNRHDDDFIGVLVRLVLPVLAPLMLAHIGASRQDAVNLADAPTAAVAGEDALAVQMLDDGLDAHLAGIAVSFQRQAIDQADRVGVQRVDFQLLLDLRAALLGRDDAIADRRQRAVPEALPRVFLQGAQDVLGVFLRLVFVEQRHDLSHHDVHGVVAHFLRDGDEANTVLRQLPDVELQLEVVAEEPREAVNHHHVKRRGLAGACLDHALELGSAVVGGRSAGFHEGLDKLIAPHFAPCFALLALVGDRHVMLGLPGGRDAQV
ncbi:hypothetical protein IT41_07490 [Paracoccus halophilus]|uniref:Uncharacterized protein n=1 Tax=Paracoccus halophilus TaxID=376733 RepID=A0A099F4Y8_9RHOB|nr:hypothetical protein IT41_07490 [Paracoccus halophilus]